MRYRLKKASRATLAPLRQVILMGESDYIGLFDITDGSSCCETVSYTPVDQLIDEQIGVVTWESWGVKIRCPNPINQR